MEFINRREFIKWSSVMASLAGLSRPAWAFLPADRYEKAAGLPRMLPFRKDNPPREIREIVPGFLWWDAADFADYGGWALDTQFVAFMGSSCLIAHGTSAPVRDAVTSVEIRTPGKYRLWVRSRNWLSEHSPGRFKVSVGGVDSTAEFGSQSEPGWNWQDGGIFDLRSGINELVLKDQTGFFGRCSSVILTRDLEYIPPVEMAAFQQERRRLSGLNETVADLGSYDVVVAGAGPSGCCAAIAAARLGASVVLISDRPVLGGNASDEIGVPIQGAATHHPGEFMRETGIVEEAVRIAQANGWWSNMSRAFQVLADREPNLTLLNDTRVCGAEMSGAEIRAVQTVHTLQGTAGRIRGRMFIDTTGDGWLGYFAGAEFRVGREASGEYQELLAPEKADSFTMSGCLRGPHMEYTRCFFYQSTEHESPRPFERQPWFYTFDEAWRQKRGNFGKFTKELQSGTWWLEYRGSVDDLWLPEEARDELIRINFSFWNYLKNDWKNRHLAENFELDYVPFMNGKRESRRLMGDHVLTQTDLQQPVVFPDAVAHTGWPVDLHALEGIFDLKGPAFVPGGNEGGQSRVPLGAQIPFRSLYSRNVSNLLMAGRCLSATHLAMGSVRVEGPCCVTGQVAGTGAALAVRRGTIPRRLCADAMPELQQILLKNDIYIPGVRGDDPLNLARAAEVSCSSFNSPDTLPENVLNGWTRPLDGKNNMWMSSAQQNVPQWIQLDFKKPVQCNTVYCIFDTDLNPNAWDSGAIPKNCAKDYRLECRINGTWTAVAEVRNNVQRFCPHRFPDVKTDAVRLTVLATNGIRCARLFEIRVYNEPA